MAMTSGKIEKTTGDLLCFGDGIDWENDGSYDSNLQEIRTDLPVNPKRRGQMGETQMHRFTTELGWHLVAQPA